MASKTNVARTHAEKKEILSQYDALSLSTRKASKILGLPAATLRNIVRRRQQIESVSSKINHKFRMRSGQFPRVEMAVKKWLNIGKERGLVFKQVEIQEKASEFANAFGFEHDFGNNWAAKLLNKLDFDYPKFRKNENKHAEDLGNHDFMKDVEEEIVKEVKEEFERKKLESGIKVKAKSEAKVKPAKKKIKREKNPLENSDFNNNNEEFEIAFNEVEDSFIPEISIKEQEDEDEQTSSDAEVLNAWKVVKRSLKVSGTASEAFFREGDEAVDKALSKHQDEMAWNRVKSSLLSKGFNDLQVLKNLEESLMKH